MLYIRKMKHIKEEQPEGLPPTEITISLPHDPASFLSKPHPTIMKHHAMIMKGGLKQ